jgi:ring-1,2-phenylacetyl-CoA epoxidase subunit PaaC
MTVMMVMENAQAAMSNPEVLTALKDLLYQLADDDLVIGHRASEWLGLAPEIEEDVAFSSISQDEVGHAVFYYNVLADLGEDVADKLAFERLPDVRRNAVMLERVNGDWAHTIVRHWFYDIFEDLRLQALETSAYVPLRQGALKIRREEFYHNLHHDLWFRRLIRAGGEARERMESAIAALWNDVPSLFDLGPHEDVLRRSGILPVTSAELQTAWREKVAGVMRELDCQVPREWCEATGGRRRHTDALTELLQTMGEVYFIDKAAVW